MLRASPVGFRGVSRWITSPALRGDGDGDDVVVGSSGERDSKVIIWRPVSRWWSARTACAP